MKVERVQDYKSDLFCFRCEANEENIMRRIQYTMSNILLKFNEADEVKLI